LHTIGRKPDSPLRVVKVSEKRNKIIDDEEWWVGNRLAPITCEVPNPFRQITGDLPPGIPLEFRGQRVVKVIRSNPLLAIYGQDFVDGRYLLAIDPSSGKIEVAFDFSAFQWPHEFDRAERMFIKMATTWAYLEDGILYVEHTHNTYARSSKGYNAYISALDTRTGMLLWRSKALVSNAHNFLVKDGAIITGYGFTAEPDFLYVLNRADGRILQKVPLKSAPEYFVEKDNKLFVRTYHTDYVFHFKK
jgi:outer membrane protein assembly factor BamB